MSKTKKESAGLGAQLRAAVENSGLTLYRIAEDSGVEYAALHRFMSGERDIKLETASKLAAFFAMTITSTLQRRRALAKHFKTIPDFIGCGEQGQCYRISPNDDGAGMVAKKIYWVRTEAEDKALTRAILPEHQQNIIGKVTIEGTAFVIRSEHDK